MPNTTLVLPAIKSYKFRKQNLPNERGHKNSQVSLPKIPTQENAKRKKTESVSGYLEKKRQQVLFQYDEHLKEEEIKVLALKVEVEEDKLNRAEKELESKIKKFEERLQECKAKAVESSHNAKTILEKKVEKTNEIKRLEAVIVNLKSEIIKLEDSMKEFQTYENFLVSVCTKTFVNQTTENSLAPFENETEHDGKELFEVFQKLRDDNLNILKILIREEQVSEIITSYFYWLQTVINRTVSVLKSEENVWKNKIDILNKDLASLNDKQKHFDEFWNASKQIKQQSDLSQLLDNKISHVYNSCKQFNQSNENSLTTTEMLNKLEDCLEETMAKISQFPAEKVQAKQKICVQKREEARRRCRLLIVPTYGSECPKCQLRRRLVFRD
ncbi:Cilia- and flagella-associated protein 100 [Chamberlinius hualienensis]